MNRNHEHPGTKPVATASGDVAGLWRGHSAAFLGIPFAASPVGERRFGEPRPHPAWEGVRPADTFGATPQRRRLAPVTTIPEPSIPGESTLNVNVFTPAPGDPDARLPVLVWIHGGGYLAGSPASPWYDGRSFNRDGVVTVTVSYRLGFDGFGWIADAPHNRGLLDQIAALEWVRDNIAQFGGDPSRVTIGGQSAGGGAVLCLMSIRRTQDLFAGAIVQSGVARSRSLESAGELGRAFARRLGVDATAASWRTVPEDSILDAQEGFGAQDPVPDPIDEAVRGAQMTIERDVGAELPFIPYVDGDLVEADVVSRFGSGFAAQRPLLIGAVAHEFTEVTAPLSPLVTGMPPDELLLRAGLKPEMAGEFLSEFADFDAAQQLGQLLTEYLFRLEVVDIASARSLGRAGDRTWCYDYRWHAPPSGLAGHCHELPFTWDILDEEHVRRVLGDDPPAALADAMHRAWVAFVRDGTPGWEPSRDTTGGMRFDETVTHDGDLYGFERRLGHARRSG